MVQTKGAVTLGGSSSRSKALDLGWQTKAWRFYGAPDGTSAASVRSNRGAIGEVRFVLGWIAQQVGRVKWHVDIGGKRIGDEEATMLMDKVSNAESTIIVTTNLVVAGELNYCAMSRSTIERLTGDPKWDTIAGPNLPGTDDALWLAVSVVDPHRDDILKDADLNLRAIWPHPALPSVADPPLSGVIDVLEEIEQLQDLAYSQNRSRIAQMGILTVASEFDLAVSPNGNFGEDLEAALDAQIVDPRTAGASPITVRGPYEIMAGGSPPVLWTRPVREFDDGLESKMKFAIQRLSWGFPVPPEILLGMTATNRAVAFQIEESTYRSHVEPIAKLVGRTYAKALKLILEDEDQPVEVTPDPTELLARRHSVADAKDAYDRGLVKAAWVRRVLGIDEEDAAEPADLERISFLRKGQSAGQGREPDPSEVSGNEPVKASASVDGGSSLARALEGALDVSYATGISRIGAAARTRLERSSIEPALDIDPSIVSNRRLPSMLGPDRLDALDVDVAKMLDPVVDQLVDVWTTYVVDEYEDLDGAAVLAESCDALGAQFRAWCSTYACAWPPPRVPVDVLLATLAPIDVVVTEERT